MFLMLMFFNLTDLMAFLVLPSSLPLQSSFPPLGLIFLYLWTCFSLSSVSDSEPLLLRRISISSLSLHQRKGFRLILGTLDKSVGGGWNGEHQREVAWAGAAATVIPCEGYIFTSKPSRVGGLQSQLKRNGLVSNSLIVSTIYLFLIDESTSPGLFILLACFSTCRSAPVP